MANHTNERGEEPRPIAALTTEIVTAYVTKNTVATAELGELIGAVGRALQSLGRADAEQPMAKAEPAVPVRRSVHDDHLVCLICGKQQRTLRRHLGAAHQLTPQAYRELFGLRPDYPMAAPGYSRQRAEMARRIGLGPKQARPGRRSSRSDT